MAAGRFREDLFFRLNVLTVAMPPLRDRRQDILPLAEHFLLALRCVHGRPLVELGEGARRMFGSYSWPGNIRELRNELERALVFSKEDVLEPRHFSPTLRTSMIGAVGPIAGLRSLEEVEREVIAATLEATRFRIGRAAGILGISRKTLLEKRKKYGLQ